MSRLTQHFQQPNQRLFMAGAVAALILTAGLLLAPRVQAGPVTGGPGQPPFVKLGVYQGVVSVTTDTSNIMEIGNLGTDIASTGNLYLRPGSAPRDDSKNAQAYLKTIGPDQLGSLKVPGEFCLGGQCFTQWPSGVTGTGTHQKLAMWSNTGPSAVEDSAIYEDPSGRVSVYPGTTLFQPSDLLSIAPYDNFSVGNCGNDPKCAYATRAAVGLTRSSTYKLGEGHADELSFGVENITGNSLINVPGYYPLFIKGAQDGDGFIAMRDPGRQFHFSMNWNANAPLMTLDKNSVSIGSSAVSPSGSPHAKLDVYSTDEGIVTGDPKNAIGIYAKTAGNALFAYQLTGGWAGYFAGSTPTNGQVKVTGTVTQTAITLSNRAKFLTYNRKVCDSGSDACWGQYLYSQGTGFSSRYCYQPPPKVCDSGRNVGQECQTSNDCRGAPCVPGVLTCKNIFSGTTPQYEIR